MVGLVVVSNIFYVHPYLGKWSNLTSIFFRWVETTNQLEDEFSLVKRPIFRGYIRCREKWQTGSNEVIYFPQCGQKRKQWEFFENMVLMVQRTSQTQLIWRISPLFSSKDWLMHISIHCTPSNKSGGISIFKLSVGVHCKLLMDQTMTSW